MHGCCGIFNDDPDTSVTYYHHCFKCNAKLKEWDVIKMPVRLPKRAAGQSTRKPPLSGAASTMKGNSKGYAMKHHIKKKAATTMLVSMSAESTAMKHTSKKVPSSVVRCSSCVSIAPEDYTPVSAASSLSKSLLTKLAPQSLSKPSSKLSSQKQTA